jgi:CheY-like chemotaxis protein
VLVVEDDPRQRESIRELLATTMCRLPPWPSANEALLQLKATTFDCMVVDFNLPDFSGYDLLEKMAQQGRSVSAGHRLHRPRTDRDEEQRLRRFSKSIIIKDARSPERLLDEVTLFIHQVESKLPPERQQMLKTARNRESALEGRRILVVEDDVRNIFALTSVLEPKGAAVRSRATAVRRLMSWRAATKDAIGAHRSGADGYHDAGDGRADRDA